LTADLVLIVFSFQFVL